LKSPDAQRLFNSSQSSRLNQATICLIECEVIVVSFASE
jgi:hypothetical protein